MGASGFLGCYVVVGTSGTRGGLGLEKKDLNGWIVVGIPGSGIWNVFGHIGG